MIPAYKIVFSQTKSGAGQRGHRGSCPPCQAQKALPPQKIFSECPHRVRHLSENFQKFTKKSLAPSGWWVCPPLSLNPSQPLQIASSVDRSRRSVDRVGRLKTCFESASCRRLVGTSKGCRRPLSDAEAAAQMCRRENRCCLRPTRIVCMHGCMQLYVSRVIQKWRV